MGTAAAGPPFSFSAAADIASTAQRLQHRTVSSHTTMPARCILMQAFPLERGRFERRQSHPPIGYADYEAVRWHCVIAR